MTHPFVPRFEAKPIAIGVRATVAVVSASLVASLISPAVHAQAAAEPAAAAPTPARQLFAEGRKLIAAGKYAEACPKLEESLRLEVGVGTQFNLADCWEHIGRNASAHALFLGAAASAKAAGQLDREQVLRDRATALEPRLSRLVIEVASTDPKLTIKRDGLPLDSASYGKAVAVDPGKYTIMAKSPGKKSWQKVVEISAAAPVTTVEIPELETEAAPKPVAAPKPAAAAPAAVAAKTSPPPASSESGADRGGLNYRALSVAAIGVAAVGVGAFMGLKYKSANDDAKDVCPTSRNCSIKQIQDHDRLIDDARTARRWSYVGFGVGGAALIGAGALWFFQRPKPGTAAKLQAVPVVAMDGSVGATLSGSF
jgi:hypothetical protein